MERHNRWVQEQQDLAYLAINKSALDANKVLIEEANQLLLTVHELTKKLAKLGLNVSYENSYTPAGKPMRIEATVLHPNLRQYAKARGIILPIKMSEDELILSLAEMEEDSMAKALDKLKLHWRKS